jgi:hypothetical protein
MKKTLVAGLMILLFNSGASAYNPPVAGEFGISFGAFYSSLEPQGEWISLESGYYAWRPSHVAREWRPYMFGRWVWTADGWYWASDEPWGWAVYHYGRWFYDDYYGWVWVPGYDWAPAWVEWRYSGDVVGWAPLSPYAIFSVGVGITYHHAWVTPGFYWRFVGTRYLCEERVYTHFYRQEQNRRYIGLTRSAGAVRYENNRIVTHGPERSFVEQRTGRPIREANIIPVNARSRERVIRQGGRESIRVYRPSGDQRLPEAGIGRPSRVREGDRHPSIDIRGTDIDQRTRERVDRTDQPRPLPPRVERSAPVAQPAPAERATPRTLPRVPSTPDVRPHEGGQRDGGAARMRQREIQPRQDVRSNLQMQDPGTPRVAPRAPRAPDRAVAPNRERRADRVMRGQSDQRSAPRSTVQIRPQTERKREAAPAPHRDQPRNERSRDSGRDRKER